MKLAIESLKKLNEGNTKYYEAGFAIHELASKASEIYRSPRATTEDKRLLLSKVFSNISMEANNLAPQYTTAFEFLTKWVPVLNNTFEPNNNGFAKRQKSDFSLSHPTLLRVVDEITTYFRTTSNYHYIPNLKDGIYPLVRPTSEQLALA